MAKNKYERLIQMGSEGFSQREWAVIHLNQAISYQFLEAYDQALQVVNHSSIQSSRSLEIDPTYEKAYYRRIQILRDMRQLDTAIASVPSWIHNQ